MKLEKQSYQVLDRGKIEIVGHTELLGKNKQIIRLREGFYTRISGILHLGNEVSLYNHYNSINTDLIRNFRENKEENNGAMISKILDANNLGPILDGNSLQEVEVVAMQNIDFENIKNEDLQKSIAFENGKEISVYNLITWLSDEFYAGNMSIEDIQKYQKLFFRQITL